MREKRIATRDSFGSALRDLGMLHDDILVFDADPAAAAATAAFKKAFPDQYFSCGVTGENAAGLAAGAAAMGLTPIVCASAMSAVRGLEQGLFQCPPFNVKIAALYSGVSGGGTSCVCDFALMRSIPDMAVLCPADDVEARAAVNAACAYQGAVYLRFSDLAVPVFHEEGRPFQIGKGEVLREGGDVALLATGHMAYEALQAGKILSDRGISAQIIHLPSIQPLDEELVLKSAQDCGCVVTCEEHSVTGGLGEAVCALLSENRPALVRRIGIQKKFAHSGHAQGMMKELGLTAEHIVKTAEEIVMQK